jgi:hypothetical protein
MGASSAIFDELEFGSKPYKEMSLDIKQDDYIAKAKMEVKAFKKQLVRIFGEVENTKFMIRKYKKNGVVFYGVCLVYSVNDWDALNFAFTLEDKIPDFWDDESLKNLKLNDF